MDQVRALALSGGIGGAKLALGLHRILPPAALTVICNTGDDFNHLGLHISPDVDTVLYTLAGVANPELGWGRAGETWSFMEALERLGGETWFRLGDGDLALHVQRSLRLAAGEGLADITEDLRQRLGIASQVAPMCDEPVPTMVRTTKGIMAFQHYFVREACAPQVTGFDFKGINRAVPGKAFWEGLYSDVLETVVICPSNPFISIDPILAIPGVRQALRACEAPVIAVSPVVGGRAVKGPTAKMMEELGLEVTAATVADHYRDIIDGFVVDDADAALTGEIGLPCLVTGTLMVNDAVKCELAGRVLDFAASLSRNGS